MYKKLKHSLIHALEIVGVMSRREEFLNFLPKNSIGAELGVFLGQFSEKIIPLVQPKELHLIDPWHTETGEFGEWGKGHNGGKTLTTARAYEIAQHRVQKVDKNNVARFHKADDIACLATFEDAYFDWIYIDSSHEYHHTKAELAISKLKVKPNGYILGHDWHDDPTHIHYGVIQAVHEFCAAEGWEMVALDKRFKQWAIQKKF
jgi:Methyltransferase domain